MTAAPTYTPGMRFTAAVTHEPPWFVARCLEVEVASQGTSVEEALANLQEALGLRFDTGPLSGSPGSPVVTAVEIPA